MKSVGFCCSCTLLKSVVRTTRHDVFFGTTLLSGCLTILLMATTMVNSQGSEGYFNGSSFAILKNTLDVRHVTSLGFRTCSQGLLFHQSGASGASLKAEITIAGRLRLQWNASGKEGFVELGDDLNDNQWHNMLLSYSLGQISITVDDEATIVANSTYNSELMHLDLLSPNPEIVVGQGYEGCLLQGAGLVFSEATVTSVGVNWTTCPLPDRGDCDGYRVNYCFSQPCHKHGTCTSLPDGYQCTCTARYAGSNCETDTGPLCEKAQFNRCQNGGICQEEPNGNSTTCACPPKYTGQFCEMPIDARLCASNPCLNNATCHLNQYGDAFECRCLPGFAGLTCEVDIEECDVSPCQHGGKCVDDINMHTCICDGTGYRGASCDINIDECAESNPCLNGGRCFDTYGSYFCECRLGHTGKNCEHHVDECTSTPCQNGGTCLNLLNRYQCTCAAGLQGTNCEINVDDCQGVRCSANAHCVDGVNKYNCVCDDGFAGDSQNCTNIDECAREPCVNGGTCHDEVGSFRCLCPPGFTGLTCSEAIDECSSSPCLNGATCLDLVDNYECKCAVGFSGDTCAVNVDECLSSPCANGGRCDDLIGDFRCSCVPGFTGKLCEADVNECLSMPCQHGGTCQNTDGNFTCSCLPGFVGWQCEIDEDDCASDPCLNNATCVDGSNEFRCRCLPEFDGVTCANPYDDCVANPCQNAGTCFTRPPEHHSSCVCPAGFTGDRCEVNIDDCVGMTCPLGFVCVDQTNGHECKCPDGYTGSSCDEEVDECLSGPCQNGATCLDNIANFTCKCPSGYTGRHCDEDVDECAVDTPCVHGICSNRPGTYQCYCQPGFSGSNCDREYDECLSRPCHNGASCQDRVNDYMCLCLPGFTGKECETDIDECASGPCLNGGTCHNEVANFTCDCSPGFAGLRCEIDIDECASGPCLHEGRCVDNVNGFVCNCDDTGFTGDFCQNNIDDCTTNPCVNDGNCTDLVKAYSCLCHPGFSGQNCESDVAECDAAPCQNGGQCLEKSNRTMYEMNFSLRPIGFPGGSFSYRSAGGYVCVCQRGFTGHDCEVNIDDCVPDACINGRCIDGVESYECNCHRGFEGRHCEIEVDECRRYRPCASGSSCQNLIGDYSCRCPPGVGGKNCTVVLRGCDVNDCLNGGSCIPYLRGEDEHLSNCSCLPGFYGPTCETSTTMSFDWKQPHKLLVMGSASQNYRLFLRFRTTVPNGLLAYGHDSESFLIYLKNGYVNFHMGSERPAGNGSITLTLKDVVSNGQWWSLQLSFPEDNVILQLTDGLKTVWQNLTSQLPSDNHIDSVGRVYVATYIARAADRMRLEVEGFDIPDFVGCMQDVTVSEETVVPGTDSSRSDSHKLRYIISVNRGCPRTDQCLPVTCNRGGHCVDLWTTYSCSCFRPHFGLHCEFEHESATFNHENTTDSHAIVAIPQTHYQSLRYNATVSLFIRTRKAEGLIFYLGNGNSLDGATSGDTFLAAELESGVLRTSVKINGTPESLIDKKGRRLDDGFYHLVEVSLVNRTLSASVNGSNLFAMAIDGNGETTLNAFHLILGGLPLMSLERLRIRRQLSEPHAIIGPHRLVRPSTINFKGVMQDIRVNDWLVNLFPSDDSTSPRVESPLDINITLHNVIRGVQSDDMCHSDPCQNDSNCTVTWNDYFCKCPVGFRGKNCTEVEYCAFNRCPHSSECRSLSRGYECISNSTFNGLNSSLMLVPHLTSTVLPNSISFHFRTNTGGPVLHLMQGNNSLELSLSSKEMKVVFFRVGDDPNVVIPYRFPDNSSPNDWHKVNVSVDRNVLTMHVDSGRVVVDNVTLPWTPVQMLIDDIGKIRKDALVQIGSGKLGDHYRGCLREVRLGDVLLPFFRRSELMNDTSENYFVANEMNDVETDCLLCYDAECQHGSFCKDRFQNYNCSCNKGYEGQFCQVDINECADVHCENGGTCHDKPASFHCQCIPGFDGERCEHEIDECASDPCVNGGTCIDLLSSYACNCSANYTGINCEKEKAFDCTARPCTEGSTCEDLPFSKDILYRCVCPPGRTGLLCEADIDYCAVLPCQNGGTCRTHDGSYICTCVLGFEGTRCEQKIDYCLSNPCHNGAECRSQGNSFECSCTENFKGPLCMEDVDECLEQQIDCKNGGTCYNLNGGYQCLCTSDYTGINCQFNNYCTNESCKNGGICHSNHLDVNTTLKTKKFNCSCPLYFEGNHCEKETPSHGSLDSELLGIIVGSVVGATILIVLVVLSVFLTMARNKRATRGTYSPSRQEMFGSRVELGHVMKPPPEERLI